MKETIVYIRALLIHSPCVALTTCVHLTLAFILKGGPPLLNAVQTFSAPLHVLLTLYLPACLLLPLNIML